MKKLKTLVFYVLVSATIAFLGGYALNIASVALFYQVDKKMEPTGFQLDYSHLLSSHKPPKLAFEWYLNGWWNWTTFPKPCDVHHPEINGRCGILEMSAGDGWDHQEDPSTVAIIYADSSLLESYRYPALNQADWPSCKQLATEQGWEYTETKVSDWQYWTKVQYTGNAIQVRIPGYTGNQSLNYDNLADNFDFLATIPENGALVINSTSSYMYDANPNAAISYSTVQKDEDLNDFIIGCVNR